MDEKSWKVIALEMLCTYGKVVIVSKEHAVIKEMLLSVFSAT